ncbi:MAG TPA: flavodoxin domain-containing protein [Bdellovibrio sp.]
MAKVLVIYASRYGQTEKIANYAAERLRHLGHTADTWNILGNDSRKVSEYEGVMIGAGIYGNRFPRRLLQVVRDQKHSLIKKQTAFFSVCMGIVEEESRVQNDIRDIVINFFEAVEWRPLRWTTFAGAIAYSKYNFLLKYFMRFLASRAGHDTDFSRDYEFTDWKDVQSFVDEFSQSLHRRQDVRETFARTDF